MKNDFSYSVRKNESLFSRSKNHFLNVKWKIIFHGKIKKWFFMSCLKNHFLIQPSSTLLFRYALLTFKLTKDCSWMFTICQKQWFVKPVVLQFINRVKSRYLLFLFSVSQVMTVGHLIVQSASQFSCCFWSRHHLTGWHHLTSVSAFNRPAWILNSIMIINFAAYSQPSDFSHKTKIQFSTKISAGFGSGQK